MPVVVASSELAGRLHVLLGEKILITIIASPARWIQRRGFVSPPPDESDWHVLLGQCRWWWWRGRGQLADLVEVLARRRRVRGIGAGVYVEVDPPPGGGSVVTRVRSPEYAAARRTLHRRKAREIDISMDCFQRLGGSRTIREVGDWPSRLTIARTGAKNRNAIVGAPGNGWMTRWRRV